MQNREIFERDPVATRLLNDGVVAVTEATTDKEIATLRYELEHFVCEGQYKDGLSRILKSYIDSANSTVQPAAWVSGFYGSGKSHLLKMLRHLWVNTPFPSDGSTARGLARLPDEVSDLLKELDTLGKRCGGLHAVARKLPSGGGESLRLGILGMLFRSQGLPEALPQAQFCLWLKRNGIYDQVKQGVEKSGKEFLRELHDMYVSPTLAGSLLAADPDFATDFRQARKTLREQFPVLKDITTPDFIRLIREIFANGDKLPCIVIVLDEIQLYIGDSSDRSYDVQEVAEALCKQLDSRVLVIGAGQTALAGNVPLLQRLRDRFTIPIELSDTDVETVTRRVVLAKKADKRKAVEDILKQYAGEIDRQLSGSKIAPSSDDRNCIVEDYPLLPVRRRFWEHVLRAVDVPGTSSQLRTQLRIVHEAVREMGEEELGTVMPADYIFGQLQPDLLRTGVLLREIDETINNLDDGTDDGKLAARLCGLIFLIRKLPREKVADIGVRATSDMLADLLVSDLASDGAKLRRDIPKILQQLADEGKIIKLGDEYSMQTRESSEWDREFRNRQTRLHNDLTALAHKRTTLLKEACDKKLRSIKILQGECKEARKLAPHFTAELPKVEGAAIPIWIRDGWGEMEKNVLTDARTEGNDSPIIFVYIPKSSANDLQKAIIDYESARTTLDFKGTPTTAEGKEARDAMTTRMTSAKADQEHIVQEVVSNARVFQGGGQECPEANLEDRVRAAALASLIRMFPKFSDGDDPRWPKVIQRAKKGDGDPLRALEWEDTADKHPVCASLLSKIGPGKRGKEIREIFEGPGYGWPRDTVDGALIVLFSTGHIKAVHKEKTLGSGQLDQAKISVTDFRAETITITARDRMKLRKLFQIAGLSCKPGEEASAAGEFLKTMLEKAENSGGEPPLPPVPPIDHLENMQTQAGNGRLAAILAASDDFENQYQKWSDLGDLAEKRKPEWDMLQTLLKQAAGLPGADDLRKQADAVANERRLLEETDLLPPIHKAVAKILRDALTQAHDQFSTTYEQEMKALSADDNWKKLDADQQGQILEDEEIVAPPALSIGDDEGLIVALEETPLGNWRTKTVALGQQFSNAKMAAARLLEPKAQNVRLSSGTLKTEKDVKDWIAKTQKMLLDKIEQGPIVIS